jgi:hypothetical protein
MREMKKNPIELGSVVVDAQQKKGKILTQEG